MSPDADGSAILGLWSLRKLKLVTLYFAISLESPEYPVNYVQNLQNRYSDQFDKVWHFSGTYHIMIDKHSQPVIHVACKCPIQMWDEIKEELESMKQQGIIRKVDEPTD